MPTVRAVLRVNKEMAGNAFFLFGSGAILDHKSGTGYTYPSWMRLVFGQNLVFDRKDEKSGQPVPVRADDSETAKKSASGAPENAQAAPVKASAPTTPVASAEPSAAAVSATANANTREVR